MRLTLRYQSKHQALQDNCAKGSSAARASEGEYGAGQKRLTLTDEYVWANDCTVSTGEACARLCHNRQRIWHSVLHSLCCILFMWLQRSGWDLDLDLKSFPCSLDDKQWQRRCPIMLIAEWLTLLLSGRASFCRHVCKSLLWDAHGLP